MLTMMPRAPLDRGVLQQRVAHRALRGLRGPVLALGDAGAHHRLAHALHHRAHVGEVQVDEPGHHDDVADPLHGLAQDVVGEAEGVGDRRVAGHGLQQPVVGDGDHGVHALAQLGQAVHGLLPCGACPPG
jgi:hypothetical protein